MMTKKKNISARLRNRLDTTGPGHRPAMPQPIPNSALPIIRGMSILVVFGR
jgi:hypothetical protein